jgi:hypothetical protein
MRDTKQPLDLSALEQDYDVIGELGGANGGPTFYGTRKDAAAKRRDDNTGVLIEVLDPPEGDEGNALSHFASDAQILMRLSHRRLIPVIEGRWVGKDVLAFITKRTTEPTLAHLLATGETFTNPRAAAILREVNGLLEWAREQKIVHRNVTPDRIYLEPMTDRVRVSFSVAPIPRVQRDSAPDLDARTIARLAMAMLTGRVDPSAYEGESLRQLRPDLPDQLIAETTALLAGRTKDVDVAAYLALVGMADPLAAGETEAERIRAEVLEEQRMEREKLAAERAAFEREMEEGRQKLAQEGENLRQELARAGEELRQRFADEEETLRRKFANEEDALRKRFAAEDESLRQRYESAEETLRTTYAAQQESLHRSTADERTKIERAMEEMRERVMKERADLQAAVAAERAALVAKRAELERGVAQRLAELDRVAVEDRARIDALRAEIQRRGELEVEKKRDAALEEISHEESLLDAGDLATPLFAAPVLAPLEPLTFDEDSPLLRDEELAVVPIEAAPKPAEPVRASAPDRVPVPAATAASIERSVVPSGPATTRPEPTTVSSGRRKWMVPAGIAGVVAVAAISAALIGTRRSSAAPARAPIAATAAPARPAAAPTAVAAPRDSMAMRALWADSATARQWLDSLRRADPVDVPWAVDIARARLDRAARARAAAERAAVAEARANAPAVANTSSSDSTLSTPPGTRAAAPRDSTAPRTDTSAPRPDTSPTPPAPTVPPAVPPA